MAASAHGSVPTMAVCVVGLSQDKAEDFHRRAGIGKSCLCYRFIHPGYDDYISDHPSLLALHEFESPVINSVHSLYWGTTVRSYPIKGTVKDVKVQYHVVEQTVFYQDVTSQPFTIVTKPDSLEHYIRRVMGPIESSGKISYRSRDEISLPDIYERMEYPSGVSKLARGFMLVIDVSQKGAAFEKQLARAEQVLSHFQKHRKKYIIVATKRDMADPISLEKVRELKKKYKTQLMETSAHGNLNIADTFRVLAAKVLKKVPSLSDHATSYEEASFNILAGKSSARRSFTDYLTKRVTTSDDRVSAIKEGEEYKECIRMIGKFETNELFSKRLLRLRNEEVERLYVGVHDNPELRQEFLEEYVEERQDLSAYSSTLKQMVQGYVDEHQASVQSLESANRDEGEAQSYHIFEKKIDSQAPSQVSAPQPQSVDSSDPLHSSYADSSSSSSYEDVENAHTYENIPHPTTSLYLGNGMEPCHRNDEESQDLIPECPPPVPERRETTEPATESSPALQKTPPPVPKKRQTQLPENSPPTSQKPLQLDVKEVQVSQFTGSSIRNRAALLQKVLSGEEDQETVAIQASTDGSEMSYLPQQQCQESRQVPAVNKTGEETSQPLAAVERDICPHPPASPSPIPPPKPATKRRSRMENPPLDTKPNVEPSEDNKQPAPPLQKAPPSENATDGKTAYVPKLDKIRKRIAEKARLMEQQALQLEETPPQVLPVQPLDPPSEPVMPPSPTEVQVPASPETASPPQISSPKPIRPAPAPPPFSRQPLPTPPSPGLPRLAGPPLPTPPDTSDHSPPTPTRPAPAPPFSRQPLPTPPSPGLAGPPPPTPPDLSPESSPTPTRPTPAPPFLKQPLLPLGLPRLAGLPLPMPPDPSDHSPPTPTRPAPAPPFLRQPLPTPPSPGLPRLAGPPLPTPPSPGLPRLSGPPLPTPPDLSPESSPTPTRPAPAPPFLRQPLPTPPSPGLPRLSGPPLPTPPDLSPESSPTPTRPAPAPPFLKQPLLPLGSPRLAGPPPKPSPKPVRPPLPVPPESSPIPVRPPLPEPSPELTRPPPPPPPVDEESSESDSLASEDEDFIVPPAVPERSEEMFMEEDAEPPASPSHPDEKHRVEKSKKPGRFSYEHVKLTLKKLRKSDSNEGKEKENKHKDGKTKNAQGSPNKKQDNRSQSASHTRAQFVDMSKRPLPRDPYFGQGDDVIDHDPDDYEPVDFEEQQMRLGFLTSALADSYAYCESRSNQRPNPGVRRAQSFQQTRSVDAAKVDDFRQHKFPSPPSIRKAASQQIHPTRADSDDSDGYVDTVQLEGSESPLCSRPLPLTPFQIATEKPLSRTEETEEAGFDYDYPDLRVRLGFSSMPKAKKPAKDLPIGVGLNRAKVPLPPRSDQPGLTRTMSSASDYVHMDSTMDDSYVNWETMHSIQSAQFEAQKKGKPPTVAPKPRRYSSDDMMAYVNLPIRSQATVALPPRTAHTNLSPLPENPPNHSPSAVKKPSPKPRKRVPNASSANGPVRGIPQPGFPPSPRLRDAAPEISQTGDYYNSAELTSLSLPERSFVSESTAPIPSSRSGNRRISEGNSRTAMSALLPPRTIKRTVPPRLS